MKRRSGVPAIAIAGAAALGFAGVYGFTGPGAQQLDTMLAVAGSSSCNIKGNVSIETGEHIYHVPGQRYYVQTKISPEYGERLFCSEAEARAAGWRRSKV